ncbi:uncharacterized protein (DUF2336 family) [Breoghania corrubedonensis]|uniref:Uncharacterized protein (DUF2336 family) n=1 Tax=Breoghania corrubedonensis TaxID=665038 RepID=A0A2T5V8M0_9HYPH|nr:DUF2336 domain-containing protein [Breoghania corrubedonensis]PTW60106.1 uncharacterized protein (DUF2336 family) [Breoghania corrubedonensis]
MPVAKLVELARDRSAKGRTALVKAISEVFFRETHIPGDIEKRLFGDVVAKILDQVADEIRADIADQIARSEHVDRDLVLALANDDAVVATPILQMSPLLRDDDLAEIARVRGESHRIAIAGRPAIGEAVTDVLAQVGGADVLRKIAGNRGARFSMAGLGHLLNRGGEDPQVQKGLAERGRDEKEFGHRLQSSLTDELRARLGAFASLVEEGRFEEAVRRASGMIEVGMKESAHRQLERNALYDAVRDGRRTLDSVISELAMEDRLSDGIWLLAMLLRLDETTLKRSLLHSDMSSVVVLCRATSMGMQGFCAFCRLICKRVGRPESEANALSEDFGRTRQEDARRTVLMIREAQRSQIASKAASAQSSDTVAA